MTSCFKTTIANYYFKKSIFCFLFAVGTIYTHAQTTEVEKIDDKKSSFILKTSPLDFIIARFILAGEYQLNNKSSIELTATYDYLRQTDIIYGGISDFGNYFFISSRYKYFPKWGQRMIPENLRNQLNGFYFSGGLELGQSPLLYGPNESVFKYVSNTHDEHSIFYGGNADIGYSWILNRWYIETFVGFNVRQNTNARASNLIGEELVYEYAPILTSSARIGIRLGYVLF